ncbi:SDR family oxidoreductase [Streptomyces fimicarius] [Streptomyces griseus]
MGRAKDTLGVRMIRLLSARGLVVGTVESAKFPALYAATSPDARGGTLYGPSGPGNMGGPPAEQTMYSRLTDPEEARRVWRVSEELAGVALPG